MERRKALATATAVSVTSLALVVALGANVGLFGLTRHDGGPGKFKLVGSTQTATPNVRTEIVDVPVPAEPDAVASRSTPSASTSRSSAPTAASTPSAASTPGASVAAPASSNTAPPPPTREPENDGQDD